MSQDTLCDIFLSMRVIFGRAGRLSMKQHVGHAPEQAERTYTQDIYLNMCITCVWQSGVPGREPGGREPRRGVRRVVEPVSRRAGRVPRVPLRTGEAVPDLPPRHRQHHGAQDLRPPDQQAGRRRSVFLNKSRNQSSHESHSCKTEQCSSVCLSVSVSLSLSYVSLATVNLQLFRERHSV